MTEPSIFLGSNINRVKEHNLRAVLRSLLYDGSLSRIQLAQKTGLSATTITNLVDELLGQEIVSESAEKAPSHELRGVGRPRSRLCIHAPSRFAIGVHMRVGVYRVGLVNLLGRIVDYIETPFTPAQTAREVMEGIARDVEILIARQNVNRGRILGLGIGASGLVNYHTGVNIQAANFGWRDVPMRDWLQSLLQIEVVVDNNVRCMVLGEGLFGAGRGLSSLVFVYGRFGVGAGIMMDGKVVRGSRLGAGEIGHTIVIPDGGPVCRCGQSGCLEPLVSEPSLEAQAAVVMKRHPGSILESCMLDESQPRPVKRLFTAYRQGDPWAKALIDTSIHYLGIALANLVNVINPELILLGGLFEEEQDVILPIARQVMVQHSFDGLGENVRIEASGFGWQAGMVGAAALALASFIYLNPDDA